ncbi:MAG: serine protease [Ignavibacteria bacterium]|nr:serine protease [Ignavibacteria bacterium]
MKDTKKFLFLVLFLLLGNISQAQQQNPIENIKKTCVFIGELNQKDEPEYYGTGFLVGINGILHLVTAKHVVMENINGHFTGKMIDSTYKVFFNKKDKSLGWHSLNEIKNYFNVKWIFHKNPNVDIAIIPFGVDTLKDDMISIPEEFFMTSERLYELYSIYFLSFQPGLQLKTKINPIFRSGTISLKNDDKTFYIDAFAFPGNSGSPVFLTPSAMRFDNPSVLNIGDPLGHKFIGVIGEYLPYQDIAISMQTKRPRVVFEENTGLAKVWSIEYLNEITQSQEFKDQINRLLKK